MNTKKLLLLGAFGLMASPAFAQVTNSSDVDQTGDDNVADVVQSGDNASIIDQDAIGAGAFVEQTDEGNTSSITQLENPFQGNGTIGQVDEDPEAFVSQSGDSNNSTILQQIFGGFNQVADVAQTNGGNASDIQQIGNGPGFTGTYVSNVTQTGGATSDILQEGTESSKNFFANVTQDASTSDIDQVGVGERSAWLRADVNQAGGSNSTISQNINADDVNPDGFPQAILADVDQQNGALSTITQNVNGDDSSNMSAVVTQDGASTSTVLQTYNNDLSNNFEAFVDQSGAGHSSTVDQADDGAANNGDSGLFADIDQTGSSNSSTLTQRNRQQSATVMQSGSDEFSQAVQTGISNELTVDQIGTSNESFVEQRGGSTADVDQSGSSNDAIVTQDGDVNVMAAVNQMGVNGTATVDQLNNARGDQASITQGAGTIGAQATITQNGIAPFDVRQERSDNEASIMQTLGTGDIATISQTGALNSASTMQSGGGNMSTTTQMGSGNSATVTQGM